MKTFPSFKTNPLHHIRFSVCTFLFFICLCTFITGQSQSFTGYNTSNYTGVNGVFFNPANAADSRYHWSFNLFQLNATAANNSTGYKLSEVADALNDDRLLNKLYDNRNAYAQANVDLLGPSLLFNAGRKTSFALTTRYRALVTMENIDGNLLRAIKSDEAPPAGFDITNNNTSTALHGWMEAGVTWGNVIFDGRKHFLKGGITAKYLGGVANNTIAARNVNSNISYDDNSFNASNASGNISLIFGGTSLSDFQASDLFRFNGKGLGFDLGLSYEFRPKMGSTLDRSDNKYAVKFSLALQDAGGIKFSRDAARSGDYTVGIGKSEQFDIDALNTDIDNLKTSLDANPAFFTPLSSRTGTYRVSLPTRLRADADVHLHKGFYVNVATQISLRKNNTIYQQSYYNNTVITPRLEGRVLGLYIPMQVNNITGFNAGAALRIGFLVIGSSNILTALGNSKMADFYIGMRLMGSSFRKGDK